MLCGSCHLGPATFQGRPAAPRRSSPRRRGRSEGPTTMRKAPLTRSDVRLAPWDDRAFPDLAVSGMSERFESPLRSRWHTTLIRRGTQGRPLVDIDVEARTLGPL